ncbi:MAG TPA: hypothetical protein VNP98_17295 [Chthoniobacterales bacterium]|nr:hypothetical protein [Chthoniobacterales bacterium]
MPKTYSPPALSARQRDAVEAGEYDFLIPTRKPLMRTDEVAQVLHRSLDFVRALVGEGRLEAHRDSAKGDRATNIITRRSVVLYLAETSDYDPAYMIMRVEAVLKTFKAPALDRIIAFANRQKNLLT